MRRRGRSTWLVALLLIISIFAAACGDDDDEGGAGDDSDTTVAQEEGKRGGSISIAAEQWPECLNPITSCANSSWLHWTILVHTLPKLMEFDDENNFVASPVLEEAPSLENGGITEDPFTVTFKIRDDAVWDDGSPITSNDIKFTWQAYLKSTGSLSTTGYDKITDIDTSDPKVAKLTFSEIYVDWWDLFGGNSGNILKAAYFDNGARVDTKDDMLDNMPFSGGPWKLTSWSAEQAVLVRNDAYWEKDRVPLLDQVTFVPRQDTNTEINSLVSGETLAAYPQPSVGLAQKLQQPGVKFNVGAGTTYEGLWLNNDKEPLNEKAVREALAYAVDRKAIVDTVVSQIVEGVEVLNCAGWVPNVGEWCDQEDFAKFTYQPEKAKDILEGAGWTLGSDGIYAKGGKKLTIEWSTVAGNKRREDTQVLVKEQAKKAGIELTFKNYPGTEFFDNHLPIRNFVMAEYAQTASPDPAVTMIYGEDQIPSPANGNSGQNFTGMRGIDELLARSDRALEQEERLEAIHAIGDAVAESVNWIPLYQLPLITAWRDDKLAGPVGESTDSPWSGFWNMFDWSLK